MPDELRERIADALGWSVQDTYGFSLPTLREVVRTADAGLAAKLDTIIRSETHFRDGHGYILCKK